MLAILDGLVELACCFEGLFNLGLCTLDGLAWSKSRSNRRERKLARTAGEPLPQHSGWTIAFYVLLAVLVLFLVVRGAMHLSRL